MSKAVVSAFLAIAAVPLAIAQDSKVGADLVNRFFTAMVKHDRAAFDTMLAPGFQSAHEDGARNKAQEIKLLLGVKMKSFRVSKLKVTREGDNLIATYMLQAAETIDDKRLSGAKPATRLTVFRRSNGKWQIISHANLRAL